MMLRIAQIKAVPEKGHLATNHALLFSILQDVAVHRPDVVITPECFLDSYVSPEESVTEDNILECAIEPETSTYSSEVACWASAHCSWFILGCTRVSSVGAHNTALISDRSGALAGSYDRVHCQSHDKKYIAGSSLPTFESDFGPPGVMICADRRWPETVRTLALKGARIIFNPTYGMHNARNLHMVETRSYESEVFIVFTHPAQSLITGPAGNVLRNNESGEEGFTITEVDLSEVEEVRIGPMAHLRDRRPDAYSL